MVLKLHATDTKIRRRAAALVYRRRAGVNEYLTVTARRDTTRFVLPAGGIDPGEKAIETATRETAEEAGAVIAIQAPLGRYDHRKRSGRVQPTQVFLAGYVGETMPTEQRIARWTTHEQAITGVHMLDGEIVSLIAQAEGMLTAVAVAVA